MHSEQAASTHFLNVDVDVEGDVGIAELIAALASKTIVLHRTAVSASLALNGVYDDIQACLDAMANIIDCLPPETRSVWNELRQRTANIGVQAGTQLHSATFAISPRTVVALAAIGCGITFTVYAPTATANPSSAGDPS